MKNALDLDETYLIDRKIGVRQNFGRLERKAQANKTIVSKKPPNCKTIYVGNIPWDGTASFVLQVFLVVLS